MKYEADMHIHTIASGHGYSTVKEIVDSAAQKELKLVAITDHGLKMPGAPHLYHFTNMIQFPQVINGVEVLRGVEADILDQQGNIDMPKEVLPYLDIVLAGFHDDTGYKGTTIEENTNAMIAAIKNPYVHIISHPGNPKYPVEVEKVVEAAQAYNKVIELNNQSFIARPNSFPHCRQFAHLAKKHNVLVAINSDAHICYNVGNNDRALTMALQAGISKNQILNFSVNRIHEFLYWHKENAQYLKNA
jgi:putative hydrolase